jgi:hypothetical protein
VVNAAPASDNATSPLNDRPYPAVQGFGRGDFFAPQEVAVPQQDRVPWNWVRTTYPLNLSFEQRELQRIWQMRLKRELSLRTMLLRLKLTAFKKAHGEYPDRLDAQDFGMDAIDPYTGTEFGYRREGFPFTFRATNSATGADEIVNARQPVLWSAGPSNVRHFSPMVANNSEIVSAHPPGTPAGAAPVHATHRFADTLALVFPLP